MGTQHSIGEKKREKAVVLRELHGANIYKQAEYARRWLKVTWIHP
jgi:hypothetical protein